MNCSHEAFLGFDDSWDKLSASKKRKRATSVERREDIRKLPLSMRKTNLSAIGAPG